MFAHCSRRGVQMQDAGPRLSGQVRALPGRGQSSSGGSEPRPGWVALSPLLQLPLLLLQNPGRGRLGLWRLPTLAPSCGQGERGGRGWVQFRGEACDRAREDTAAFCGAVRLV